MKGNLKPSTGSFYDGMLKGDMEAGINTVSSAASLIKSIDSCECTFITHHTVSGKNLTGPDFLKRKDSIIAALEHEIQHGDMDKLAAIRRNKQTL